MTDTPDSTDQSQPAAPDNTDPNDFTGFQVPPKFRSAIWASEGGPGTGLNKYGYAGAYQMGASALQDAGMYKPADGENVNKNQWKGQITIPGYAPMGVQDFVANQGAQDAAFSQHMHNLATQAHAMGLDQYIGQTIGGVPITQETLAAMMHFAGPTGAQRFLTSGGSSNPADGNGVKTASYAGHVSNYMGGLPTVPVASNDTAANDGTAPPLHFPAPGDMTSTQTPNALAPNNNSQFAQLQKLALLNRLMPPQTTANVPQAGNPQFPWVNSILNANKNQNPLQTALQMQQLQAMNNGQSLGYASNPLLQS